MFGATAAAHVAGAAAVIALPASWPWVLGALAANHAGLALAGLIPRSGVLGPNLVRLPPPAAARGEVALTFDDGPDPDVTPRVLDVLDEAGAKGSFFLVGKRAARHPGLAAEIVRRGHAVESHSHSHSTAFGWYGLARLVRELGAAQAAIADAAGVAPVFFRAPFGMRNPLLEPALCRVGLRYVSWTRRGFDTFERNPSRVADRLSRSLAPGDVLLLHDRTNACGLAALPLLLARLSALGLRSVTLRAGCADG